MKQAIEHLFKKHSKEFVIDAFLGFGQFIPKLAKASQDLNSLQSFYGQDQFDEYFILNYLEQKAVN